MTETYGILRLTERISLLVVRQLDLHLPLDDCMTYNAVICADLRQIDKVGQDSRVMDVEVPLQLVPDGLTQQLHAVVGRLSILLCARAYRHTLRGVIVWGCITQGPSRLLLTPGTSWRAGTTPPTCMVPDSACTYAPTGLLGLTLTTLSIAKHTTGMRDNAETVHLCKSWLTSSCVHPVPLTHKPAADCDRGHTHCSYVTTGTVWCTREQLAQQV